ncbi:MAG: SUMF1/EgtB/PvdO family nonheme iron enzyme [Anaerolineae bacterium]|nr:SUMF1/EgtB/PvdO family nonheme iron enzyme [Anaerolineae bacterium]
MSEYQAAEFFKVGGALAPDAPGYVIRQADEQLLQAALAGRYCHVLTARQMGKSSLMVRTASRLREKGIRTVMIDLSEIGANATADQWYFGLISRFKRQLILAVDDAAWWREREQLGPLQRFSDCLRQVVLEEIQEPVVVFIDEIDSTLNLPFTDDFFAVIRALYNARASDPACNRLTFVLLGVARPSDLIKERTRTPYNIGTSIDLHDFTTDEAQTLLEGLAALPGQQEAILQRVLHWTGGHPYLTQKVCAEIVEQGGEWGVEQIDGLVRQLFLAEGARKETNLQFIRERVQASDERGTMLRVYRKVWNGRPVQDEERSVAKSQLKLTGLVKTAPGAQLAVRNRIYRQVFDRKWIQENMPVQPMQWAALAAAAVAVIAILVVSWLIYQEKNRPVEIKAETYRSTFLSSSSADVRITNLANLFELGDEYQDEARNLFFDLDDDQRLALFEGLSDPQTMGSEVVTVVKAVYQDVRLENRERDNQLLRVMARVLYNSEDENILETEALAMEIDYWMDGRDFAAKKNWGSAKEQYTKAAEAINDWNPDYKNPAILFDRGVACTALGEYEMALSDLQATIEVDKKREIQVKQIINQNSGLFTYLGLHRQEYLIIATWFPTLTPTYTPTHTPTGIPMHTSDPTATLSPTPTSTVTPILTPAPTTPVIVPGPTPTQLVEGSIWVWTDNSAMVYVPAGVFWMGSTEDEIQEIVLDKCPSCDKEDYTREQPLHEVYLDAFWIDQTEVTNTQFAIFLNEQRNLVWDTRERWWQYSGIEFVNQEYRSKEGFADYPVVYVTWDEAVAYCQWAGKKLPTEAEWERAARGVYRYIYPWGNDSVGVRWNFCDKQCIYSHKSTLIDDGYKQAAPIGSYPLGMSPCGTLDMAGNVSEWVMDWYSEDFYKISPRDNPQGPLLGRTRVIRGGSFDTTWIRTRSTYRDNEDPEFRFFSLGFRCARSASEPIMTPIPIPTVEPTKERAGIVYIPAGEFVMGSNDSNAAARINEKPQHKVYLDAFWIDRTEVTNAQYKQCVDGGHCDPPTQSGSATRNSYFGNPEFDDYPVIYVNWEMANQYCLWVDGRVPTEAEWEKAARGTDGRIYPWGNNFDGLKLNFCDTQCTLSWRNMNWNDGYADTAPVGSYLSGASSYGVLDMAGNVWEWVADWYDEKYYEISPYINPQGSSIFEREHIHRGGSWDSNAEYTQTALRYPVPTYHSVNTLGFRCAYSTP